MVTRSILRHLLCDKESLMDYTHGKIVSVTDVKRRLLLLERSENRMIPDHYYRLNQEQSFDGIDVLGAVFTKGLAAFSTNYLELVDKHIYVKQSMQTQWQELLTYIPPLLLQSAFLHTQRPLVDDTLVGCRKYFHEYIQPNFTCTALPHPYIPQLEHYISANGGLCDLHMHLNGTTETDLIWQDLLFDPDKAQEALHNVASKTKVAEQKEQEALTRSGFSLDGLLRTARTIRQYLFGVVTEPLCGHPKEQAIESRLCLSSKELLCGVLHGSCPVGHPSAYHPFCYLFASHDNTPESWLSLEALMYVLVFRHLEKDPRKSLTSLFHFYLLILGLANRLLVQQTHQYGFEQFQKITLNDLRRNSERDYRIRFLQLHGNERRNIKYLEGRFAPQPYRNQNEQLMHQISRGWNQLVDGLTTDDIFGKNPKPTLTLIAHFIKRPDNEPDCYIRHKELRHKVWQCAQALAPLLPSGSGTDSKYPQIVGADAASSEFDAPPEVFAPAFRYLRHHGMKHFTYHAGEDFYHLLGGLRAIYEAVEFNDLGCGDRIGHATAAGIAPEVWIGNVGDRILVRRGEYLDDLVFAYHLIITRCNHSLKSLLPYLEREIDEHSYRVYGKSYPLSVLIRSWQLRKYNPELLFATKRENACQFWTFDCDEWELIEKEIVSKSRLKDDSVQLLMQYHSYECRKNYEEIIDVATLDIFDVLQLSDLQLAMLQFIHQKEIAIETLPTSNVRIGHHHTYETYHLWRWWKWHKEGKSIPPIVVGTDDAGIFATNIYNEFANIYCHLTCQCGVPHTEAMRLLEQLDKNGQIYSFSR